MIKIVATAIDWQYRKPFRISRATITHSYCVRVQVSDLDGHVGHSEAEGLDYAGETQESMLAQIEAAAQQLNLTARAADVRQQLISILPLGGARNALDCALWDLEAKASGIPVWRLTNTQNFNAVETAYTLGISEPDQLRQAAKACGHYTLLKVKTNREQGLDPIRIVHQQVPHARLIVDPNQAWSGDDLVRYRNELSDLNVVLLEQPLSVDEDAILTTMRLPVPVAADESFTDTASINCLIGKYQVLNIKLDKTGGLTEALRAAQYGLSKGFKLMVGCSGGSSLAMAPGLILAQGADFVDLDGPLLLGHDCEFGLIYSGSKLEVPSQLLWG